MTKLNTAISDINCEPNSFNIRVSFAPIQALLGKSTFHFVTHKDCVEGRQNYRGQVPKESAPFILSEFKGETPSIKAQFDGNRHGGIVTFSKKGIPDFSKFYIQLNQTFGPYEESDSVSISKGLSIPPFEEVVTLIPCYNVAKFCREVIEETLPLSKNIIIVDDGSTDETPSILKELAQKHPEQIHLISFKGNKGKGHALLAGFKYASGHLDFEVLVAIDSDSQHRPPDIPRLAQAVLDGEDFVIGARCFSQMPFRSRFANNFITMLLQRIFSHAPHDTQSGFRAFSKGLLKKLIARVEGGQYEMEFDCLLYALLKGYRVRSLPISTIYVDKNASSHFAVLIDSIKIIKVLLHYGSQKNKKNKVLFIELNEFNYELLDTASRHLDLKNIQKILALNATQTHTDDLYGSDYLEPWVQWVSLHTGSPSSEHKIKHLGDVPHLDNEQIWEKLSKSNITSGIWGAMNASKAQAENCLFFLPDPWTASEGAYPSELEPLLDLLRYSTKNYLNTSNLKLVQKLGRFILFLTRVGLLNSFRKEIPNLVRHIKKFKGESFAYISLFDYLSTLLFLKMKQKHNPDFSLIFLNRLAHMQHHHWKSEGYKSSPRFKYTLEYIDRAFKAILDHLQPEDTLIVANALSQKNTNQDKPWILYRQKDQKMFLEEMGLSFSKVEPHMTHDAHLFFKDSEDCQKAQKVLKEATIEEHPFFHVESYKENPLKLFYKIIFTDKVSEEAQITIAGKQYRFFDLFQSIIQRTGKHVQTALMLSNRDCFPKKMHNHEIFNCISQVFNSSEVESLSQ